MAGRRKVLDLVESQVIEGYRNGLTLRDLAKMYEVSAGTVRNLLVGASVPLRTRGLKRNQVDAATPLVDSASEDVTV